MTLFRQRVLITGGSGTLGHAIVMKAEREKWGTDFTIYSRSELQLSRMKSRFPYVRTIIGDVRDYDHLRASIAGHDGVIHAAALKRIPECEESPRECFLTNVQGSENVARACTNMVEWVIGISTDKACRASTTYGASKLMMESIFLAAQRKTRETRFHLVRYGNVVASNGSVIPFWRSKYERKEKLPITDREMTRFWMSPFDAVDIIRVGLLDVGPGLVYVPKVRACKMIALAEQLFPGCELHEVGLRSNEKRHEDLVGVDEETLELNTGFVIGLGTRGKSYSSSSAEQLLPTEFERMLQEAEEVEK